MTAEPRQVRRSVHPLVVLLVLTAVGCSRSSSSTVATRPSAAPASAVGSAALASSTCLDDLKPFLDKLTAMDLDASQGLSYPDFTTEEASLATEYRSVHWAHVDAPCTHIQRPMDKAVGIYANIASNWATCEQTDPSCKADFRPFLSHSLYGASVDVAAVHDAVGAAQRAIDES